MQAAKGRGQLHPYEACPGGPRLCNGSDLGAGKRGLPASWREGRRSLGTPPIGSGWPSGCDGDGDRAGLPPGPLSLALARSLNGRPRYYMRHTLFLPKPVTSCQSKEEGGLPRPRAATRIGENGPFGGVAGQEGGKPWRLAEAALQLARGRAGVP